jgi:hypothetical protein
MGHGRFATLVALLCLGSGCVESSPDPGSAESPLLDGVIGSPHPENVPRFYRMGPGGSATAIQPSAVHGPNVAVVLPGFSCDWRAMTSVTDFLVGFPRGGLATHAPLYQDVIVFQYDTYHTRPSVSAGLLRDGLDTLPANVKGVDFYAYSLGNMVTRYAYERLAVGSRMGDVTRRIVSLGGLNYGVPDAVVSSFASYVGFYVPDLMMPPPTELLEETGGGARDDPQDPLRSAIFKELNDNPSPFADHAQYFVIAGTRPDTITPHPDPVQPQAGLLEKEYQALAPSLDPQSDGILSIKNARGDGVLDARRGTIVRREVATDHLHMIGIQTFLGHEYVPGSGYQPVLGPLHVEVEQQLRAWLATFPPP